MRKLDRTGLSAKRDTTKLIEEKSQERSIFKEKDIVFFLRFIARNNLRKEAFELLRRKLAH